MDRRRIALLFIFTISIAMSLIYSNHLDSLNTYHGYRNAFHTQQRRILGLVESSKITKNASFSLFPSAESRNDYTIYKNGSGVYNSTVNDIEFNTMPKTTIAASIYNPSSTNSWMMKMEEKYFWAS